MLRSDFNYHLPEALIAQEPLAERTSSRLLQVPATGAFVHGTFKDIRSLLKPADVLVLNDTLVIKARLRGEKDSGGRAEVLVERILSASQALCQVRVSKPLHPGREIRFTTSMATVEAREGEFYRLTFNAPVLEVLDREGEIPLPPYVQRAPAAEDLRRYQTVFARHAGAVAAPTAGLHFDASLLDDIRNDGVSIARITLHVGAGTFQPLRTEDLSAHRMHGELYTVTEDAAATINQARSRGGRVIAVGTTVVRTLESAADDNGVVHAGQGETALFITPGYQFKVVDALVTNFHLPQTTLLLLVCAFAGRERLLAAYAEAVTQKYRFFSYGDAQWLEKHSETADV
jgi:S-adenosylmethionine:tRNA ribosyltransferase-isomerase